MGPPATAPELQPTEPIALLLRDLRSSREGLSTREAARRLVHHGPNELKQHDRPRWPVELLRQLGHPLALLLWLAALLALAEGSTILAIAIVTVVLVNGTVAFVQERHAERSLESLSEYLPPRALALRDGRPGRVDARALVPGDVVILEEGDRVPADGRLIDGALEVDLSMLTGESQPVERTAWQVDVDVPRLQARELVFSGTRCIAGHARAVVFATGMHTELGRIAALSQSGPRLMSPLERQVKRVAWTIAAIALAAATAFLPVAIFVAGLPPSDALTFAIGLLVANVPEGLLPIITLSLALSARRLARRGALLRRLSAVETLGATTVICTDKTGTLTENRMRVSRIWTAEGMTELDGTVPASSLNRPVLREMAIAMASCNNAERRAGQPPAGDPTEVALLAAASRLGDPLPRDPRAARRRRGAHQGRARGCAGPGPLPCGPWRAGRRIGRAGDRGHQPPAR